MNLAQLCVTAIAVVFGLVVTHFIFGAIIPNDQTTTDLILKIVVIGGFLGAGVGLEKMAKRDNEKKEKEQREE